MTSDRTYAASTVAIGLVALAHAVLTWPLDATVALFGGGAVVAFLGELVVIRLGWLDHHIGPKLAGVPIYVLFGWTGVVYVSFRAALLVADGWAAVALAALVATGLDVLSDPQGVADERWTYTDDLPGPRHRGVPWWNYAGWVVVSATACALALQFL